MATVSTVPSASVSRPDLNMIFSDEFNGTVLPDATHDVWNTVYPGNIRGGLNGEKQIYLDSDYRTSDGRTVPINPFSLTGDGTLTITGNKTPTSLLSDVQNFNYTSGMINTYDQYQFKYGYFEVRMDTPGGQGMFPAFWLRNADSSVKGEIDIVELIGKQSNVAFQTVHKEDGTIIKANRTVTNTDYSVGFHTYGVDWQPDTITFYVDGAKTGQVATPSSMHIPMYLIANLAIGGTWPGDPDSTTPWPATMKIDYIRVWQDDAHLASVTLNGTASADRLFGNDGSDVLRSGDGNDTILAAAGNDLLDGGAGADRLVGGMGNDTLVGGTGADYLAGGVGNDTYIVNETGDTFYEVAKGGFDTIETNLSSWTLSSYLEGLRYTGTSAFKGVGNAADNRIEGGVGNDTLVGSAGSDTLKGGAGNDKLDGGLGKDVFVAGGGGADFVNAFSLSEDRIDVSALGLTSRADAVAGATININGQVVLKFGAETLTLAGVTSAAQLTDAHFVFDVATTGTDTTGSLALLPTIYGTDGNDTVYGTTGNDRIDGKLGTDVLNGGAGDDTYVVHSTGKSLVEKSGGGHDTVETTLSGYTLGGYVEDLKYTGASAFKGYGNGLNNVITGGSANDVLVGGAGNDTITGGAGDDRLNGGIGNDMLRGVTGHDTMTGDAGNDVFQFSSADGPGTAFITDFQRGYDKLDLRGMGLADFDSVLAHASNNASGFATIVNQGETVTLQNVKLVDLHATDFIF